MEILKLALKNLDSNKYLERKTTYERVINALENQKVVSCLEDVDSDITWNSLFQEIMSGFRKDTQKLQQILNKGTSSTTIRSQVESCRDLLFEIVKIANKNGACIKGSSILNYFQDCSSYDPIKTICFENCLILFYDYFLKVNEYWFDLSLPDVKNIINVLKSLCSPSLNTQAINCLSIMIERGVKYKLPLSLVKDQAEFIINMAESLDKTSTSSLRNAAFKLFLVYCQVCGKVYRKHCLEIGDAITKKLLLLHDPYENCSSLRILLMEILVEQLRLHNDVVVSDSWFSILKDIDWFVVKMISKKDSTCLQEQSNKFNETFLIVALECYCQTKDLNLRDEVTEVSLNESISKRAKRDDTLATTLNSIAMNMEWPWLVLLTEIIKKYPMMITLDQVHYYISSFTNYIKDCTVISMRGLVFACLNELFHAEESLVKSKAISNECHEELWQQIGDAAIRELGLSKNVKEIHELLRELIRNNRATIKLKLYQLYSSKNLNIDENTLKTLNVLGQCNGVSEKSANSRIILIDYILDCNSSYTHLFCEATAQVLSGLTYKKWPGSNVEMHNSSIHKEVFDHLISAIEQLITSYLSNIDLSINLMALLINLIKCYDQHESFENITKINSMLDLLLFDIWRNVEGFLKSENNPKSLGKIISTLLRLFSMDLKHYKRLKNSVTFDLMAALVRVRTMLMKKEENQQAKLLVNNITRLLCKFSLDGQSDLQQEAKLVLFNSKSMDLENALVYSNIMVTFEEIQENICQLDDEQMRDILQILEKLCSRHYKDYTVCVKVIQVINYIIRNLHGIEDLTGTSKNYILRLFCTFHDLRTTFQGRDYQIALLNCFDSIIAIDPDFTWTTDSDGKMLIFKLPDYVNSDHLDVIKKTTKCLVNIFEKKSTNSSVVKIKWKIFNKTFERLLSADVVDKEFQCFEHKLLHVSTQVAIAAKGGLFTQQALINIVASAELKQISLEKIVNSIGEISLKVRGFHLDGHLEAIFAHWTKLNLNIAHFPFKLFSCDDLKQLCAKFLSSVLPILMKQEDKEDLCKDVIQELNDKGMRKILEDSYSKVSARALILTSFDSADYKGNRLEDLALLRKSKELLQQVLGEELLSENILFECVKAVYDLKHLHSFMNLNVSLPKSTSVTISHKCLMEIIQLMTQDQPNMMDDLSGRKLYKMQRFLHSLRDAIYLCTNTDYKIIEFHRYIIFIELLEPFNEKIRAFLIRDIISTLINLMDEGSTNEGLPRATLKYLNICIDRLTEPYAEQFRDFLIPTWNALVKMAPLYEKESMDILSKILNCENIIIRSRLQYLDPLPDKDIFVELRNQYMETQRELETNLKNDIERFLLGAQFKGCRTEGLKHLRLKMMEKTEDLKGLYQSLQTLRGEFSDESLLHKLVCYLIELVSSSNKEESNEAAKCLGVLGASDLSTTILKMPDAIDYSKPALWVLTSIIAKSLCEYLTERDINLVNASSEALYSTMNSLEVEKLLKRKELPVNVEFLLPYLPLEKNTNKMLSNIDFKLLHTKLSEMDLWYSGNLDHETWITKIVTTIFQAFDATSYVTQIIPILKYKTSLAESCLPVLLAHLIYSDKKCCDVILSAINYFFEENWINSQSNNGTGESIPKSSLICMLNCVQFIRLHRKHVAKSKSLDPKETDLPLNYLHIAYAGLNCFDNFLALMYAEMWCRKETRNMRTDHGDLEESFYFTELDFLAKQERNILQHILKQSYERIGDSDALQSGHLSNINDCDSQAQDYITLGRSDLALLNRDFLIQQDRSNLNSFINLTKDLQSCALYELSLPTKTDTFYNEHQYEAMWRLGRWDELNDVVEKYECYTYFTLNALKDKNEIAFKTCIEKARNLVSKELSQVNLESCKNIYPSLSQLQRLHEIETIFQITNMQMQDDEDENRLLDVINTWSVYECFSQNDFNNRERLLSQRVATLDILNRYYDNVQVQKPLVNFYLQISELGRNEGNIYKSTRNLLNVSNVANIDEEMSTKIMLEQAQVYWMFDRPQALRIIEPLLKKLLGDSFTKVEVLRVYASWMVETNASEPQTIINKYFLPCINMQEKLLKKGNENVGINFKAYETLANFAHQEYQEVTKYINSPDFECKQKFLQKYSERAKNFPSAKNAGEEARRAKFTYQRLAVIEETEIDDKKKERDSSLQLALTYYLKEISLTKDSQVNLFRVLSLWLENRTNADVISIIDQYLLPLPSQKVLIILPQLVPHLSLNNDNFSVRIMKLIEKCAVDHPHHALPLLLAVANTDVDDAYTTDKISRENNEDRVTAAKALQKKLMKKNGELKQIITEMQTFSAAIIQLAYYVDKSSTPMNKIPDSMTYKMRNLSSMHLPTCPLTILKTPQPDYSEKVIGVEKFEYHYNLVGGINAPKQINCIGTDGRKRTLLVKGKDDMRQDAVMQQVFTIMNSLLGAAKSTKHLQIRTYKVVPLSKRSGILEWVSNSLTLGEYLTTAHEKYRPNDMRPKEAKLKLPKIAGECAEIKLIKFLELCKKIQPVFHKFFEVSALQPTQWYEKRRAYIHSLAASSMCGYILGIGDRHVQNILLDKFTAEVIHIDFGIAFEQGHLLPTPETVPFRLTRDIVDGMGVGGVEGTFRKSCEKTMETLRQNAKTIQGILEVLLYDPLYQWTVTHEKACSKQFLSETVPILSGDEGERNVTAERALSRLKEKFQGDDYRGNFVSVESQVDRLIRQARDPRNLCKLYYGWQAYL